jgi:hypothetical protein
MRPYLYMMPMLLILLLFIIYCFRHIFIPKCRFGGGSNTVGAIYMYSGVVDTFTELNGKILETNYYNRFLVEYN